MKWLYIIPFAVVLLAVGYMGTELQTLHRRCDTLTAQNDTLMDIIRTRRWVDQRHFSMLITNVQWLNYNTAVRRPSIKHELVKFRDYWELWGYEK